MKGRSFIYAIASSGLLATLVSAMMLGRELVSLGSARASLTQVFFELVAGSGAPWFWLGAIGAVAWVIAWFAIERKRRPDEVQDVARKAYLYIGQGVALAAMVIQAIGLVSGLLASAQAVTIVKEAAGIVVAMIFWAFLRWTAVRDGDFGQEMGAGAHWRRAYSYLAAAGGLALLCVGAAELIQQAIAANATVSLANSLSRRIAQGIVGALVLAFALGRANRLAIRARVIDAEYNALSRKIFLYGWSTIAALAMLAGLYSVVSDVFFRLTQTTPLATMISIGWGYAIVGTVAWVGAEMLLRSDATRSAEDRVAATIRRSARFGVAAAALAAFLVGLSELLRIIVSTFAGVNFGEGAASAESRARFVQAAALALVGAPAWWGFWWSQQSRIHVPEAAEAERNAVPRRIYLYGIVVVSAAAFFFSLGMIAFDILSARGSTSSVTWAPVGIVALLCLVGHLAVLRNDEKATSKEKSTGLRTYVKAESPALPLPQQPSIVVIDGRDGILGARLVAGLAAGLPAASLWPIGLNATAQLAMRNALDVLSAAPADALERAALIVGPADTIVPGGLGGEVTPAFAAAVCASSARKLLLPPRDPTFRWVAAPAWPDERWIENAVTEATNLLA